MMKITSNFNQQINKLNFGLKKSEAVHSDFSPDHVGCFLS